jgi:hypothetical protein
MEDLNLRVDRNALDNETLANQMRILENERAILPFKRYCFFCFGALPHTDRHTRRYEIAKEQLVKEDKWESSWDIDEETNDAALLMENVLKIEDKVLELWPSPIQRHELVQQILSHQRALSNRDHWRDEYDGLVESFHEEELQEYARVDKARDETISKYTNCLAEIFQEVLILDHDKIAIKEILERYDVKEPFSVLTTESDDE